jgi:FkbM family methyltransferase
MLLGKILRFVLDTMGWNERVTFAAMQTSAALTRITARGIEVGTVIDIGASNGSWSQSVMPFFPKARYLLVEAQQTHEADLKQFVSRNPNAEYVLKAAGEKPGTIFFDASEAFAGQAMTEKTRDGLVELPVCSIDDEVSTRDMAAPYLLKFDVHGFELAILRGAEKTLANTSLLIMECYNFEIAPESMLFYDMCRYLHERGFRVVDMSEPLWRKHDNALWQMDIFFVRADRPEFQYNSYR